MKLLIVDDSALVRNIVKDVIKDSKEIILVGEATNGEEAVKKNRELSPDLIVMDIDMPIMNGLEATKKIMKEKPVPIMIFSRNTDTINNFNSMKYGAVDCMQKPEFSFFNDQQYHKDFINKLITLAKIKVRRDIPKVSEDLQISQEPGIFVKMIVMGASTGGPTAVAKVLSGLPEDLPVGIALVQHIETGFDEGYAQWLASESKLKVRLAKDRDSPEAGEVLVAPTDKHLVFKNKLLHLEDGAKVLNQKPSVDVLFESAANCFGSELVGVLLTGMGSDGANGCVKIKKSGGYTIVQDESSSMIFGMPKVAIEKGGASIVVPLNDISTLLINLVLMKRQ